MVETELGGSVNRPKVNGKLPPTERDFYNLANVLIIRPHQEVLRLRILRALV